MPALMSRSYTQGCRLTAVSDDKVCIHGVCSPSHMWIPDQCTIKVARGDYSIWRSNHGLREEIVSEVSRPAPAVYLRIGLP